MGWGDGENYNVAQDQHCCDQSCRAANLVEASIGRVGISNLIHHFQLSFPFVQWLVYDAAQRLGSAAARVRGSHLRQPTDNKAREAADLRARSAASCNPLLGGFALLRLYALVYYTSSLSQGASLNVIGK